MRLQAIEIKGFKSFANPTTIHFPEVVTGIVGPNGTGKSNIIDAIRWVLGEQKSRELRLEQMQDVIFNGAAKRKPAGMAQVTLTFENNRNLLPTSFSTVAISRLLYRTGESAYQLNGVTCRLKDITNLFLDTGIGSNSYAIIALGMVDDILEDKDDARRRMFEQAAGVSKYKVRKREALAKLKSATEDLDRIEDLLHEIATNLKALEKQARRTQKYVDLKQEYRTWAIEMALLKTENLKEQYATHQRNLETSLFTFQELETTILSGEAALELIKKTNLDHEISLSQEQRKLSDLSGQLRSLQEESKLAHQRQEFVLGNEMRMQGDAEAIQHNLDSLKKDVQDISEDAHAENHIVYRLELELQEVQKDLVRIQSDHNLAKGNLDQVLQHQLKAEKEIYEMEKARAVLQSRLEIQQTSLENHNREIKHFEESKIQLDNDSDNLTLEQKANSQKIALLQTRESERLEKLVLAENLRDKINQQLSDLRRKSDALINELKLTRSMVDNLEGFPESIHFLSKNAGWAREFPLLTDIIYVDEAYRVAIENYLEPYLNYFVVPDVATATMAVETLTKAQKGKANFFILSTFAEFVSKGMPLVEHRRAIDLVKVDEPYLRLCQYLLDGVYVIEKNGDTGRLPEIDISLLHGKGHFTLRKHSISGGSIGLFEGKKIGRKKNISILEEKINELENEEEKLLLLQLNNQKDITRIQNESLEKALTQEKVRLQEVLQQIVRVQSKQEEWTHFQSESNQKMDLSRKAILQIKAALEHNESDIKLKSIELEKAKTEISQTDLNFRGLAERLSQTSSLFNDKNIQYLRQENKVENLRKDLTNKQNLIENQEKRLGEIKAKLNIISDDRNQLQIEQETIEGKIQLLSQSKADQAAQLATIEGDFIEERNAIVSQEESLRRMNRERLEKQTDINRLKEEGNDIKLNLNSISQRLQIEFSLEGNDITSIQLRGLGTIEEILDQVVKLKSKLENFGEINPLAIDAYSEMKERYDAISSQRDDILQAKDSLEKTIFEIGETASTRFLDAFSQVRTHFIEVFRSLFTADDSCDLVLTNPLNPLDSGIEIVAKPKGKKPQSISQLSGGEKTLTAIALLFALYLLKPAPFCIFDEVDAPLDDANIAKFNRIIRKFSEDSQFIIVTHNKLTMAAVETIYGVFMAEQGVSGITAVDLREFQLQEG